MVINKEYKYMRIQSDVLAANTLWGKGVFSIFNDLIRGSVMEQEDEDLFRELDGWFSENLPWPPQCMAQEAVICWFKTENSEEMMKMIKPMLWLLDKYERPYYVLLTDSPGEIVYEDKYQIVARAGKPLQIDEVPESWSPKS